MIFDEVFFAKLDRVKITDDIHYIYFFNYMDRMWGEIGFVKTNEVIFESQITTYKELFNICNRFCEETQAAPVYAFMGMVLEKLFETKK